MPELSNSFRAGKMNKDDDERIVSNGEYRDALNIEVTTSESSNVGTAQTILGNKQVTSLITKRLVSAVDADNDGIFEPNYVDCTNFTVGHIVDEKKDRIIRLVASPADSNFGVGIDRIMEYNTDITVADVEIPIFVDVYRAECNITSGDYATAFGDSKGFIVVNTNSQYLREGMQIKIESSNGGATNMTYAKDIIISDIEYTTDVNYNFKYTAKVGFTYRNGQQFTLSAISGGFANSTLFAKSPRVLNFDTSSSGSNGITMTNDVTGINLIDDLLFWTDNYSEPKKINIVRSKKGTVLKVLGPQTKQYLVGTLCSMPQGSLVTIPAHERHTYLVVKDTNSPDQLATPTGTGVNSNLLPLYTQSVPLPNGTLFNYNATAITESHITVIRKGPVIPPTLETFKTADVDNSSGGTELPEIVDTQALLLMATFINGANVPWSTTPPDNGNGAGSFTFEEHPGVQTNNPITSFDPGDILKFTITYTDSVGQTKTSELIATIQSVASLGVYNMMINSTSTNHPTEPENPTSANYFIYEVEKIEKKPMWETKFPRFATRWKYSDGEYSVFSPFTNVAYVPDNFDYLPKKGYNLGMQNNLRYLEISDFIPKDIPRDVVQVDIVYKESSSPNVYTVESFKPNDTPEIGQSVNPWNKKGTKSTLFNSAIDRSGHAHYGSFIVDSDLIHATIPANQLLRPWDNVPRVAIAQEMTGNRVVYANYLQNYDLIDSSGNPISKPEFLITTASSKPHQESLAGLPGKSLKSMRNYQLGVVYRDEYGRETPVLTSKSATIKIPKSSAAGYNKLDVAITTEPPAWAKSYKFFVKETSNEYYNLAMDRYYSARDGNFWLSFPSSERNKITEESFIELKKEHNNNNPVTEPAKYKVIAIENNAPDYIKTEKQFWGSITPLPSFVDSGAPYTGKQNIEVELDQWNASAFGGLVSQNIDGLQAKVRSSVGNLESLWYDVTNVGTVSYGTKSVKRLTVKNVFGEDMEFTSNDGGTSMIDNLVLDIRQKKVINKAQFDGRFFVKIQKDATIEKRLQSAWGNEDAMLIPLLSKKISYMSYIAPGVENNGMYNGWDNYRENGPDNRNSNAIVNGSGLGNGGVDNCAAGNGGQGWSGHTNFAREYSVPYWNSASTYYTTTNFLAHRGLHDPRDKSAGANGVTTMFYDIYFKENGYGDTIYQPMVAPRGSRWNCVKCQNSPGPFGGAWRVPGTTNLYYKNDPVWTPGHVKNGPFYGDGSCYVRGTGKGTVDVSSNFSGAYTVHTRNPVGGMLAEYCNNFSSAVPPTALTCGSSSTSSQSFTYKNVWPSSSNPNATTPFTGSITINHSAITAGSSIGWLGLGSFSTNQTGTLDYRDDSGTASMPVGYQGNTTLITDISGNLAGRAGGTAIKNYLKDEILGGTGWYARDWLRHTWVHSSNPTDLDSYKPPYVYTQPMPGTGWDDPAATFAGTGQTAPGLYRQKGFHKHGWSITEPTTVSKGWLDMECTQSPGCNPNYGCVEYTPPPHNHPYGCEGDFKDGYRHNPANTNFWVFAARHAELKPTLPEPNTKLPYVYREEQYPLMYPRRTGSHAPAEWWANWWEAKGIFRQLKKPTDVLKRNADGSSPTYSTANTFQKNAKSGTQPAPEDNPSRRWIVDHIGAAQDKCGAGYYNDTTNGTGILDISFIGVGTGDEGPSLWNMSETPTEMGFADALSTPGTRFRFKEDHNQTVYTITNSHMSTDGDAGYLDESNGIPSYSSTPHNENPEILNYENDPKEVKWKEKLNRRIRWRLFLDRPIGTQSVEGSTFPYYNPFTGDALDYNLVDTYGTYQTNPNFNPYGSTIGWSGEANGKAQVTVDGAVNNALVITLDQYLKTGTCSGGSSTGNETCIDQCDAVSGTWTTLAEDEQWQNHNLKAGMQLIGANSAFNCKFEGNNVLPQNDYDIKIDHIDETGCTTVILLTKPITVNDGATLNFRWDPAHIYSFEARQYTSAGQNYSATAFNSANRFYDWGSWEGFTSNDYTKRHYMYTHNVTTVKGQTTITYSAQSTSSTTPTDDFYFFEGDIIGDLNSTSDPHIHRNCYLTNGGSTSAKLSRPALKSGTFTATFWRPGHVGMNEWGLNWQTIEILTTFDDTGSEADLPMSPNPAIWETEPREDLGMDIYMEASQAYPIKASVGNVEEYIKVGDEVQHPTIFATNTRVTAVHGNLITVDTATIAGITGGETFRFKTDQFRGDGSIEGRLNKTAVAEDATLAGSFTFTIDEDLHTNQFKTLDYFNIYSFMNGVESNRMRDDYNEVTIDKGVKASMPMATPYEAERRKSGLIFSGIYNSTSGVNETNQFIQAEPITKDLNPDHGAIQKIFTRDSDLVTFCEDKVFKILSNKDAVFSAGGNASMTATNKVLGQAIPFTGEYGMSDRRSFAEESFRMYFVDKNRGAVLRLSRDGMTPISDYGMKDFFFDNLKSYTKIIGSYNDRKSIYNVTLDDSWENPARTVSYTEDTRGWVSFKSFVPEGGCGFNNTYYTFSNGEIYEHHYEKCKKIQVKIDASYSHGSKVFAQSLPIEMLEEDKTHEGSVYFSTLFKLPSIYYGKPGIGWAVSGVGIHPGTYITDIRWTAGDTTGADICTKKTYEVYFNKEVFVPSDSFLYIEACAPRNNFYWAQYDSSIDVLMNGGPDTIKAFSTMKYEGSQAMIKEKPRDRGGDGGFTTGNSTYTYYIDCNHHSAWQSNEGGAGYWGDGNYFNNVEKPGWYVSSIKTDQQEGKVKDFKNKEGKWFNYIIGNKRNTDLNKERLDTKEFSLQGIDIAKCATEKEIVQNEFTAKLVKPTVIDSEAQPDVIQDYQNNIETEFQADTGSGASLGFGFNYTIKLKDDLEKTSHQSFHATGEKISDGLGTNIISFILDPNPGYYINAKSFYAIGTQLNTFLPPSTNEVTWNGSGSSLNPFYPFKNPGYYTQLYSDIGDTLANDGKISMIKFINTTVGWQADNKVEVQVHFSTLLEGDPNNEQDIVIPILGDATQVVATSEINYLE